MTEQNFERFQSIVIEFEANAWLEKSLLDSFQIYEDNLKAPLSPEDYKACRGILTGRLPRPVLKHLYLLAFYPLTDEQLEEKAKSVKYNFSALHYHYHKNKSETGGELRELPQAFLEAFLVKTMYGDISKGSAHKLLTLFVNIGLLKRKPCVTGNNSLAIVFDENFKTTVEEWLDRKNGVYSENIKQEAA